MCKILIINAHTSKRPGQPQIKFRHEWFDRHPNWLEYSVSKDAAFCRSCRLFFSNFSNADVTFARVGFKNWKKATVKHTNIKKNILALTALKKKNTLPFTT